MEFARIMGIVARDPYDPNSVFVKSRNGETRRRDTMSRPQQENAYIFRGACDNSAETLFAVSYLHTRARAHVCVCLCVYVLAR